MSDNFETLVDVDATPSEAEAVAQALIQRFRELGLITGSANEECVLGGIGYLPWPAVAQSYELEEHEVRFRELVSCGVAPAWKIDIARVVRGVTGHRIVKTDGHI